MTHLLGLFSSFYCYFFFSFFCLSVCRQCCFFVPVVVDMISGHGVEGFEYPHLTSWRPRGSRSPQSCALIVFPYLCGFFPSRSGTPACRSFLKTRVKVSPAAPFVFVFANLLPSLEALLASVLRPRCRAGCCWLSTLHACHSRRGGSFSRGWGSPPPHCAEAYP